MLSRSSIISVVVLFMSALACNMNLVYSHTKGEGYLVITQRKVIPITVDYANDHNIILKSLKPRQRSTGNENRNVALPKDLETSKRAFDFNRRFAPHPLMNTRRRNINLNILSNINLGEIIRTYQGRPNATDDERDIPKPMQGRRFVPFRWF